jgi:DnaK suppressor protein
LLKRRRELARECADRLASLQEPVERGGSNSIDVASAASERDTLLQELSTEEAELIEVDAALERIREGNYGFCVRTGRPISAARLEAVPWTRYCQEAAEAAEKFPST